MKGEKKVGKRIGIALIIIFVILIVILLSVFLFAKFRYLNKISEDNDFKAERVSMNLDMFENHEVTNIALFGLDTRKDIDSGRSDAVIILTLDRAHDKIKITSVARDTYVKIEKTNPDGSTYTFNDKLTHAYSYGGPELAVKTLNQNFDMNISDYVTVNFFQFVEIIDYIGGVEVDVSAKERSVMNKIYLPGIRKSGIECEDLEGTGLQILSGAQALAYSRDRYSHGGDIQRGNRQKEVLVAAYEKIKKMKNILHFDKIIEMLCSNCVTSLKDYEILDIAVWTAYKMPQSESFTLPTANCNPKSGNDAMVNGVWYYIYDLDIATEELHKFIKETDDLAPMM